MNITPLEGVLTLPEVKLNVMLTLPEVKLNVMLTLPEIELNIVVHLNGEEARGHEPSAMSRLLEKASGLSPEMQEIIASFADFLAKEREQDGQAPVT